ncbi:RNA polymerase subunit sigma [Corallococcus sp. H22C18031201]|uniref:RNA polymerase sigma factor n=1 Tax=Citreicoccus inhibens TaxID=2849499 RepID=UPI000E723A15|nr:sigma-70 family RNA polymerase sigma factor [Citreicoccus inhibens]MBU8900830.1 sigma-70 family RNA polymerase sigma factor [Citreicoccus inhibens]RJS17708.1 RNA polymerase subunit sigma [Corallococcus sp. H22C18031201]
MPPSSPARSSPPSAAPLDFECVYAENAAFVWRTLRRMGVRDADLEDVCQETFVVVHRRLPEFDGRAPVAAWLFGICFRLASDYRKRAHIRRETAVAQVPDEARPPEQLEALARAEARARLDVILDTLDEDKRAVFVLFEIEQWSMAEVAQAVGCPLQTAYARLYAARKQVQDAVVGAEGGER